MDIPKVIQDKAAKEGLARAVAAWMRMDRPPMSMAAGRAAIEAWRAQRAASIGRKA